MEEKIYSAQGKIALVISQSKYKDPKVFPALPNSLNDGKQMRAFLEDYWGIEDVYYCTDLSIGAIEKKFMEMQSLAAHAGQLKSTLFAVVYYSGHGTIRGRETYGHTVDNEPIPIESYVRRLALRQNTFVLGVFDCCRLDEVVMAAIQAPDMALSGQYKILFSALPNKPALAGQTDLSKSTENFFTHFKSISKGQLIFPDCLNNYYWKLGEDTGCWKLRLVLDEKDTQIKQEEKKEDAEKPSFTQSQQQVISEGEQAVGYIKRYDSKGWNAFDKSKDLSILSEQQGIGERKALKVSGKVDCSVQTLADYLTDPTFRQHIDERFESGKYRDNITQNTRIIYLKFKAGFFVSARDFNCVFHIQEEKEGTYVVLKSIDHLDSCKYVPDASCVRGDITFAGWLLKKVSAEQTWVSYYSFTDVGGNISYSMQWGDSQLFQIENLRTEVEGRKQKDRN